MYSSPRQKENHRDSLFSHHPCVSSTPQPDKVFRFHVENSIICSPQIQKSRTLKRSNTFKTKQSTKECGIISSYAAITDQGLIRSYNEDRVSIMLNISNQSQPESTTWPSCSFFGIYDGHGGNKCADYLRDNLHQFIIKDANFPFNAVEAIFNGFKQAESNFSKLAQEADPKDFSGSCAIIILLINDICYIANLGDSRGLLSSNGGKKLFPLSTDHKPDEETERTRIESNGGQVYQNSVCGLNGKVKVGPFRVLPGRLSVSRTIGDIYAKVKELGGNDKTVISCPDIKIFRVTQEHDFIFIASDGVFDTMSNKDVLKQCWRTAGNDPHSAACESVRRVIAEAMERKSHDNLTAVIITFKNFYSVLSNRE